MARRAVRAGLRRNRRRCLRATREWLRDGTVHSARYYAGGAVAARPALPLPRDADILKSQDAPQRHPTVWKLLGLSDYFSHFQKMVPNVLNPCVF